MSKTFTGIVSIDYDDTWTRDPELMLEIAQSFQKRGYLVLCITMRLKNEPVDVPFPVIYTGRMAKAEYAHHIGLEVDLWLDDSPHWLTANSFAPLATDPKRNKWDDPKYYAFRTNANEVKQIIFNARESASA